MALDPGIRRGTAFVAATALLLASCGGESPSPAAQGPTPTPTPTPTAFYAQPAQVALTVADVQSIVAHAAAEASARGLPSVISVVDRVGNVLAVFRMANAPTFASTPTPETGIAKDAQGLSFPMELGAIAKALTGAYLSSGGNAFSTRTASMIVQQHFPPAPSTVGLESGPLFGVQFSQLPCSDLASRYTGAGGAAAMIGPKRSPLGLAADPGGLPLYKNGVLVGGIGVMGDRDYGFDKNVLDIDEDAEEYIALAGTLGFEAPEGIRADRIYVDGTQLRYVDASYSKLMTNGSATFAQVATGLGTLVTVRGYFGIGGPAILAGTPYGSEASGVRPSRTAEFANGDAYVLTDGSGNNRFPLRAGQDGAFIAQPMSQAEVTAILEEAFKVMTRARAQIRQPLDSRAQVTISVVDTRGNVLGLVRSPDAPIFGTDVSLQKARTATFFSDSTAGAQLLANPDPDVAFFVANARAFLGDPSFLTGTYAFPDRANGNLSRPHFPDGEASLPNGPFSRPLSQWSPFSTGLQSALIFNNLKSHAEFVIGAAPNDVVQRCTNIPDSVAGQLRLANGVQIFPGSVPIYRGNILVGGIGVSGDGIDQDDMISFLGAHNGGARTGGVGNAPRAMRSDNIVVNLGSRSVRLRYVNCPFAPFLDTGSANVCEGL